MESIERKIVVLGDSGVGKTALVHRFVKRAFSDDYKPTAGAVPYKKIVEFKGKSIDLTIWDVAGHTLRLHPAFTSDANGAILVCDLGRPTSFDSVLQWHDVVRRKAGEIPAFLKNIQRKI